MKELTTEQIVEIREEVFNAENPRAAAEELCGIYGAAAVGDALQLANTAELPTANINAQPLRKKKPGPKPGFKKQAAPKPAPPKAEPVQRKPKAAKTVVLTAETAAVLGQYLEGSLQRDIREGLGGDWTLNDLRLLLFAQGQLATYGEE